jgi:hypothetical protein
MFYRVIDLNGKFPPDLVDVIVLFQRGSSKLPDVMSCKGLCWRGAEPDPALFDSFSWFCNPYCGEATREDREMTKREDHQVMTARQPGCFGLVTPTSP